jgi:hypothetical protein
MTRSMVHARIGRVQLRDHPLMRCRGRPNWPPAWTWIDGKENKNPKGELGMLKQVKLSSVEPLLNRCFLWMEYEGSIYLGCLLFDNKFFCERISTLLGEHSGSSICGHHSLEIE